MDFRCFGALSIASRRRPLRQSGIVASTEGVVSGSWNVADVLLLKAHNSRR